MISNQTTDINLFDKLKPEKPELFQNKGTIFKKYNYKFNDADGENIVNIYATEIPNAKSINCAMSFSCKGDYCINLTKMADKKCKGTLISSLNTNFGLIVDEEDICPLDITYNLHLENYELFQIPVADKSAILINKYNKIEIKFLKALGTFTVKNKKFNWIGSLSKQISTQSNNIIAYNSFNRGLMQITDPLTKTKKVFDKTRSYTPKDKNKIDLIIKNFEGVFKIYEINTATKTHFFKGHLILSIPKELREYFKVGDSIDNFIVDGTKLTDYKFGASGGALLTPDVRETRKNIRADRVIQTRTIEGGSAFKKHIKFCRSCIIQDKDKFIFLLVDARKSVKRQEGFALYKLRGFISQQYPTFINAVNVDGGHAPKLIIKREKEYDLYGNLHYKIWPQNSKEEFKWDGYRGRKVPAIIYTYLH